MVMVDIRIVKIYFLGKCGADYIGESNYENDIFISMIVNFPIFFAFSIASTVFNKR